MPVSYLSHLFQAVRDCQKAMYATWVSENASFSPALLTCILCRAGNRGSDMQTSISLHVLQHSSVEKAEATRFQVKKCWTKREEVRG